MKRYKVLGKWVDVTFGYKVLGKWVDVNFAEGGVWADVGCILEHDGNDIFIIGKDGKLHRTINSDAWLALMIERGDVQEI